MQREEDAAEKKPFRILVGTASNKAYSMIRILKSRKAKEE